MRKITCLIAIFCITVFAGASQEINNPAEPLKGEVELTLKKTMEINPENFLDVDPGMFFNYYGRSKNGDFFLVNSKAVIVYKFSKQGKFVTSFLRKGNGPGEFDIWPFLRFMGEHLFIYNQKNWGLFNRDGKLVKDGKLAMYYSNIIPIDADRFIANDFVYADDNKELEKNRKTIYLVELQSGKKQAVLVESEYIGRFSIPQPKGASISIGIKAGIIPDLIYDYDAKNQCVVYAQNHEYKIYKKNLRGMIKQVFIKKSEDNANLTEEDKKDVIKGYGAIPEHFKKAIFKRLPDRLCAIDSIHCLPNGWVWVNQILGYERFGIDIFDENGRYLYRLKIPKDVVLKKMRIYDNSILVGINEEEDNNVLVVYSITNASKIFK